MGGVGDQSLEAPECTSLVYRSLRRHRGRASVFPRTARRSGRLGFIHKARRRRPDSWAISGLLFRMPALAGAHPHTERPREEPAREGRVRARAQAMAGGGRIRKGPDRRRREGPSPSPGERPAAPPPAGNQAQTPVTRQTGGRELEAGRGRGRRSAARARAGRGLRRGRRIINSGAGGRESQWHLPRMHYSAGSSGTDSDLIKTRTRP